VPRQNYPCQIFKQNGSDRAAKHGAMNRMRIRPALALFEISFLALSNSVWRFISAFRVSKLCNTGSGLRVSITPAIARQLSVRGGLTIHPIDQTVL
jgi:hypothetical protein